MKYGIVAVEGVSKLSFQCGSRDAKFCVSTIWLNKPLILNNFIRCCGHRDAARHVSTPEKKSHFDAPPLRSYNENDCL